MKEFGGKGRSDGGVSTGALLDALSTAILVAGVDGKVRVANSGARALLGTEGNLVGVPLSEVLNELFVPRLKEPQAFCDWFELSCAMIRSSFSFSPLLTSQEVQFQLDEDRRMFLRIDISVVRDPSGNRTGDLLTIEDITDARRLEAVLNSVAFTARETSSHRRIQEILPGLYNVVKEQVALDAMAVLLFQDDAPSLVLGAVPQSFLGGKDKAWPEGAQLFQQGVLMEIVSDLGASLPFDGSRPLMERVHRDGYHCAILLPLLSPDKQVGLWVLAGKDKGALRIQDVDFLEPVSEYLGAAVHNAALVEKTREMYLSAVKALAAAVDTRDPLTMHHSRNVSAVAQRIAEKMGLPAGEVEVIGLAGLVHDIGKLGVPDGILLKPGPLDAYERSVIQRHASLGAAILETAGMLAELVPLVRHHHEWYDGTGYPDKLAGDTIPLGASILAVADAFDTMVSDRLYRSARSAKEALKEIKRCAGTQFHPDVVRTLADILSNANTEGEGWLAQVPGYTKERGKVSPKMPLGTQLKELGVLVSIAKEIGKPGGTGDLLNRILALVVRSMGYSDCQVLLSDEEVPYSASGKVSLANTETRVPLEIQGMRLGVLRAQKAEATGFSVLDAELLKALAGYLSVVLAAGRLRTEAEAAGQTDGLTGLYNRKAFLSALPSNGSSVVVFDVQGISRINDRYGYSAGDAVLVGLGDCLKRSAGPGDVVGRCGGDEFAVLMKDTGPQEARRKAETIIARWSEDILESADGRRFCVPGASFGVASVPEDGLGLAQVLLKAERRAFEMKKRGSRAPNHDT